MSDLTKYDAIDRQVKPKDQSQVIRSLRGLNLMGKPKSIDELRERTDQYLQYCEDNGARPGIESYTLAIHSNQRQFQRWEKGIGCDPEWQEEILSVKQFIGAYLEQVSLMGKLNPATSCFLFKNWLHYKDQIDVNDVTYTPVKEITIKEIQEKRSNHVAIESIPDVEEF